MHATFNPAPQLYRIAIGAIIIVASLSGCSRHRSSAIPAAPVENILLQITNRHFLDITIYAIHDGQRTRLGVAGGTAHTKLMLPSTLLGMGRELRLYGDPIGSSEVAITEAIVVKPGQFIEWLLEPGLGRSSVGVY